MGEYSGRAIVAIAFCAAFAGCVTTQEMPLAPNVVRLDTRAKGALFVGKAGDVTLQRAAQVTIKNGYEFFRLEQPQIGQGSQLAGVSTFGSASIYGSPYGATAFGSGFSTPIYAPTSEIGVTVLMFHPNEAGAKGAFNAAELLKKYGS
jgi:hypothetical protein